MYITLKNSDSEFANFISTLKSQLTARMINAGSTSTPTELKTLTDPPCNAFFAQESYPLKIHSIRFAFKNGRDPAGVFPLRGIEATLSSGIIITRGCTSDSGVTMTEPILLSEITAILSIKTYYCVATSDTNKSYQTRILAYLITATTANYKRYYLVTGTYSRFHEAWSKIKNSDGDMTKLPDLIEQKVSEYNYKNNDYNIRSFSQDQGIETTVKLGNETISRTLVNIGYHQFSGSSTSYINNMALIFSTDIQKQLTNILDNVKKISVSAAFTYNPIGGESELEITGENSLSVRDLVIAEKGRSRTFKIPSIELDGLFATGDMYAYTRSNSKKTEKENTSGNKNSVTFKIKVPQDSYVATGFPACKSYRSDAIIGLYTTESQTEGKNTPQFEITIPIATPCICINGNNGQADRKNISIGGNNRQADRNSDMVLAQAILNFI